MMIVDELNSYYENLISTDECIEKLQSYSKEIDGVVIFGAMQTGAKLLRILERMDLNVLGFLDEYVSIKRYENKPVYHSVEDIKKMNVTVCFVIASHLNSSIEVMKNKLVTGFGKNVDILDKSVLFYCNHGYSLKRNDGAVWSKVDLIITNCCTLKCKNCCTLTPYVEPALRKNIKIKELKKEVKALNDSVDVIVNLDIIGGEPLLHPDLAELIYYVDTMPNIYQIMVDTNGTVLPSEELLKALSDCNVMVHLTDYGEVSDKTEEVMKLLEENNIIAVCRRADMMGWHDYGEIYDRGDDGEDRWEKCQAVDCPTIYNSRLHICAHDARFIEMKLYEPQDRQYVDFTNEDINMNRAIMCELKGREKALYACRFCGGAFEKIADNAGAQL